MKTLNDYLSEDDLTLLRFEKLGTIKEVTYYSNSNRFVGLKPVKEFNDVYRVVVSKDYSMIGLDKLYYKELQGGK